MDPHDAQGIHGSRLDPKRVVADGYDRIADRYAAWAHRVRVDERERYTRVLLERIPAGAVVLDLGCGSGIPLTRRLAERFLVTGVDISAQQVERARRNVPGATFIHGDMARLTFPPASFDGVTAFYSLTHLPLADLPQLLRSIAVWLRPGGILVASMGAYAGHEQVQDDWLGVPMFFSGYPVETNQQLIRQAGLEILEAREETADEDGQPVRFLWVVAERAS